MSDFPAVQILMATYNGEAFLAEQLDSILGQTYPNWQLLIRDDGSKDKTPEILAAYQQQHKGRIRVVDDGEGNLGGCSQNFERLCTLSSTSIVAFADQDDVWHPHKVSRSVETLLEAERRYGESTPLLIHHDFSEVDAERSLLCASFDAAHGQWKSKPPSALMPFAAGVHGFSMTVNRPLLTKALPFPQPNVLHDCLLGCLASDIGRVEYIPEQLAEYRRHGANASYCTSFAKRVFEKLFVAGKLSDLPQNLSAAFDAARSNLATKQVCTESYLDRYRDLLPPDRRKSLGKFAELDQLSPLARKITLFEQQGISWRSRLLAAALL